ncbi:MAG: tetratricopeptide repeat protein [Desulfomonilaceae bacterium]
MDHHAWHYIGLIYSKDENYPKALVAFQKAANLQPKNVLYCLNAGRMAGKMEDWKASELFYDRALKLDPKNDEAYQGVRYARLANSKESEKKAKQATLDRGRQLPAQKDRDSKWARNAGRCGPYCRRICRTAKGPSNGNTGEMTDRVNATGCYGDCMKKCTMRDH